MSLTDTDITAIRIYFPEDGHIKVHQSHVSPCPVGFPAGYYWYGGNKQGPGRTPKWLERLLQEDCCTEFKLTRKQQMDVKSGEQKSGKQLVDDSGGVLEPACSDNVSQPQPIVKKKTRTREIVPPARYRNQLGETDV